MNPIIVRTAAGGVMAFAAYLIKDDEFRGAGGRLIRKFADDPDFHTVVKKVAEALPILSRKS